MEETTTCLDAAESPVESPPPVGGAIEASDPMTEAKAATAVQEACQATPEEVSDDVKQEELERKAREVIDNLDSTSDFDGEIPWDWGMSQEEKARYQKLFQWKLALISPVIFHTHDESSDKAYLRKVAERVDQVDCFGKSVHLSVATLERMVRNYRKEEMAAFYPKRRADLGHTRVLPYSVQLRIVVILQVLPATNGTAIYNRLLKEGLLEPGQASVDSVRRFIRINHLKSTFREATIRMAFLEKENGYLWAADTCYLAKIKNEEGAFKWVYVMGIIDDHSRLIVAAKCCMSDNSLNFQITLREAIENYYIPVKLYVDNGKPYSNDSLIQICNALSITLIHTRARDGAAKGVVERMWRTQECQIMLDLVLDGVNTLDGIQKAVDAWVVSYNNRVNRGVNDKPMNRYLASLARHPVRKPESPKWLSKAFSWHDTRRISNTGTIQQDNAYYCIPESILKAKPRPKHIDIFWDPLHVTESICATFKGKTYSLKLENREENAGKKRELGGRMAQLKEQAEAKKAAKLSVSEERAEERFRNRLAGSPLLAEIDKTTAAFQAEAEKAAEEQGDDIMSMEQVDLAVEMDLEDEESYQIFEEEPVVFPDDPLPVLSFGFNSVRNDMEDIDAITSDMADDANDWL